MPRPKGRAAVFLDRDDTLMADVPYARRPEDVRLLPGAAEAVRALNEAGWLVVVVTNQSGVARGYFTEADLGRVNAELERQLAAGGAHLDAIYACPHLPTAGCTCRKPGTALFEQAGREHGIDPAASVVVGDRGHDIEAGRRIGAATVLLRNDRGMAEVEAAGLEPAAVCDDLPAFVRWLAARKPSRG